MLRVAIGVVIALTVGCREHGGAKSKPVANVGVEKVNGGRSVQPGNPLRPEDLVGEDVDKDAYIPAEFKSGAEKWRDTGVYLDGKPIGMLSFAELPLTLAPTWVPVRMSAEKRADKPEEEGWRMGKQRRYKFTDYLRSLGVDPSTIKELHLYGSKASDSVVVTGKDLTSPAADEFFFRFGGRVYGKALPSMPANFGNGKSPDKITSVMIYVKKTPPELVRNEGFFLDGVEQKGVPYFGEPLRGGVRVYLDNRLVAYIKRQDLPTASATADDAGNLHWKLYEVLAGQGVDTSKIAEGWVIREEQRKERLSGAELSTMTFEAGSQAKGRIQLGPQKLAVQSLALHSTPIDPATFPKRDPENE
jgi:hypothetical protein